MNIKLCLVNYLHKIYTGQFLLSLNYHCHNARNVETSILHLLYKSPFPVVKQSFMSIEKAVLVSIPFKTSLSTSSSKCVSES